MALTMSQTAVTKTIPAHRAKAARRTATSRGAVVVAGAAVAAAVRAGRTANQGMRRRVRATDTSLKAIVHRPNAMRRRRV